MERVKRTLNSFNFDTIKNFMERNAPNSGRTIALFQPQFEIPGACAVGYARQTYDLSDLRFDQVLHMLQEFQQRQGLIKKAKMSGAASRAMKFPYTFSAKLAQFPYKFYTDNIWLYKYYLIGIVACAPVFYKIGKASYAPNNVRVWDEKRRIEFSGHPHH